MFRRLWHGIGAAIWRRDLSDLPRWKAWAITVARVLRGVWLDYYTGRLGVQAASLVFSTLLSLVPLLALSLFILARLGIRQEVELVLVDLLRPLGADARGIAQRIVGFVQNADLGALGVAGVLGLIFMAFSMVQQIEMSLNDIWRVALGRPLLRRYARYVAMIVTGPVVMFGSVAVTLWVVNSSALGVIAAAPVIGVSASWAKHIAPYVLIAGGFAFMYRFVPNAVVSVRNALIGGSLAAVLWQSASWAFAAYMTGSTRYSTIYSTFATLILLLFWLYYAWLIFLIGSSIAYHAQFPARLLRQGAETPLNEARAERLALVLMIMLARRGADGPATWNCDDLSCALDLPQRSVAGVLGALEEAGLITQSDDDPPVLRPARSLGGIGVKAVIDAVRKRGGDGGADLSDPAVRRAVDRVIADVDAAAGRAIGARTVADLVEGVGPMPPPERPGGGAEPAGPRGR